MGLLAFNLPWLVQNSQRHYPISEDASATDSTGSFTVPDQLLLELNLSVPAGLDLEPDRFFIGQLNVFAGGFTLTVSYDDGTSSPPGVATAVVPFSGHTENNSYAMPGVGEFQDLVGRVTVGRLDELQALPAGSYVFGPEAGRIDPDCVRPQLRGVTSIVLVNGNDRSERLYGDIELEAGTNIRLSVSSATGLPTVIRFDAVSGEGLSDDCGCGDTSGPPIRTINDVRPTASGDFTLRGDACVEIDPITNGLQLRDVCSAPCATCKDLEVITQDLANLFAGAANLTNFVNRLEARVTQTDAVVLGSRTGDRPCS